MYSLSTKAQKSQETSLEKPFPVFESLIGKLADESTGLFADVNKAYEDLIAKKSELESSDKGKAVLDNAKQITLLIKDFRNYMRLAVKVVPGLPVVIPWWLGGNKDEEEETSEYVSEYARGGINKSQEAKQNFLKWLSREKGKPADENLWFPDAKDKNRTEKIKRTFQYLSEALKEGKISGKKLEEKEAKQIAKEILEKLGYREDVAVIAYSRSVVRTASLFDQWNAFNKRMQEIYQRYFPELEKAYEALSKAWEPDKFKKNRQMLTNFVKGFGKSGVGLLEMGKVFQDGVDALVKNFATSPDQMSDEDREIIDKARKEKEQGEQNLQQNQKQTEQGSISEILKVLKEQFQKLESGPESVRELAKTVSPLDYNDKRVDDLIERLKSEKKAQSEIKEVENQEEQFKSVLMPVVENARDVSQTIEDKKVPDEDKVKELRYNIDEAIKGFRELSTKVKALDEFKKEEGEEEPKIDEESINNLRKILDDTLDTIVKHSPNRAKEADELRSKAKEAVEKEAVEKQEEPKVTESEPIKSSLRGLSRMSQQAPSPKPISFSPTFTTPPSSPSTSLSNELQDLINKAKEIAKEEGITEEEKQTKSVSQNIDLKLDKMLIQMSTAFKTVVNDQIGAVSRILEGLKQQGIEVDDEKVTPIIEEAINKFRTSYFDGIDKVIETLAGDNKIEIKFFRGDQAEQQKIIDEVVKKITTSWDAVQNDLVSGITKGLTTKAFRTLSLRAQQAQPEEQAPDAKVQKFVETYLNTEEIVKMLKDVFKKTIDKNRQEVKALVEKQKEEITEK